MARRTRGGRATFSGGRGAGSRYHRDMDWSKCTAVDRDPETMGGVCCFSELPLQVAALFEHLDDGYTVDEFIEFFPEVTREQVHDVLEFARTSLDLTSVAA